MSYKQIKEELHLKVLAARNTEYIVNSDDFAKKYRKSSVKYLLDCWIRALDYQRIKNWLNRQQERDRELEQMTFAELKIEAKRRGKFDISELNKSDLLGVLLHD